jgi:hypothetical protein
VAKLIGDDAMPMKTERIDKAVEQLNIAIDKRSEGGAGLKIEWENIRALVNISKKT